MIGTIKSLDVVSALGVIAAEDGLSFGFSPSELLAFDVPSLAIGQVVSFDLAGGRYPMALNVVVQRAPQAVNATDRRPDVTNPRYIGFEHRGNTRAYLFQGLTPGAERGTFTVDADLALFARHHVGMQEGPALCLHLLVAELGALGAAATASLHCSLTDREMLAHLASRPVRGTKHGPKRTLPASGASPHVA